MRLFFLSMILCVPVFAVSQTSINDFQTGGSGGSCGKSDLHDRKEGKGEKKEAKAMEKGKSMSLTGWVKEKDGKTVFENDKDKQTWDISNPDMVKGHDGHHVKMKAKLNEADHSLNVEKLTMMRQDKQAAEEQKDEKK